MFWQGSLENVPLMLVGNKCDEVDARELSVKEGEEQARQWSSHFMETSAKTNHNVKELFQVSRSAYCAIRFTTKRTYRRVVVIWDSRFRNCWVWTRTVPCRCSRNRRTRQVERPPHRPVPAEAQPRKSKTNAVWCKHVSAYVRPPSLCARQSRRFQVSRLLERMSTCYYSNHDVYNR